MRVTNGMLKGYNVSIFTWIHEHRMRDTHIDASGSSPIPTRSRQSASSAWPADSFLAETAYITREVYTSSGLHGSIRPLFSMAGLRHRFPLPLPKTCHALVPNVHFVKRFRSLGKSYLFARKTHAQKSQLRLDTIEEETTESNVVLHERVPPCDLDRSMLRVRNHIWVT